MRFKYLDVLKAIAIICVVLYHSGFLPDGYLGVDLFLVINGYFVTRGLSRRLLTTESLGGCIKDSCKIYLDFEFSRIIRLLPVLLVAGIVCMLAGFFVMLPDDYENLSESVVATNVFCNNILAALTTKNYWDVVNEYKPLMHTWYVGLLMQFYLIYPLLFFLARIDKSHAKRTLFFLVSGLAVTSLSIYLIIENSAHRFYFLPARFFEFAVGGIVALIWSPETKKRVFNDWFVYICYAILLTILTISRTLIPSSIKIIIVVALSAILLLSMASLENRFTGNSMLARFGAASYSIYVWHQVLLAFYRYTYSSHFTLLSYALFLVVVLGLSWLTYHFLERQVSIWVNDERRKTSFIVLTAVVWLALTGYAGCIYMKGGVVRDVPELYITKGEKISHNAYNDKVFLLDKPFETSKRHWLVIGDSFGRDFANAILESPVSDSVEVSYVYVNNYDKPSNVARIASADRVFFSSLGGEEEDVRNLERTCLDVGFNVSNIVIVGTKNFGESNGQIYVKRNRPDYHGLRVKMEKGYWESNARMKSVFGNRYLDLISLVIDEDETVPVFTPDHHFISQDCRHFSEGGAKWFSQLIDWDQFY